mmetsp:Transcript_42702/g.128166  ORF Transcript_42702/g.128166 Transcript_42702/m.128166 type:complete len:254 (-) Transcript_42702:4862-5623(-)
MTGAWSTSNHCTCADAQGTCIRHGRVSIPQPRHTTCTFGGPPLPATLPPPPPQCVLCAASSRTAAPTSSSRMRARAQIWSWRSSRPVQPPFPLPRCRRAAFSAAQHRRPNSVASTHATGSSMSGDDTKSASEQRMPAVCNAVCISGDRSCGGNTGSGGGDGGCNWPKACAANAPAPGAHAYATWRAAAAAAALRRPTTLEGSLAPAADAFLPLRRLRRRRRAASPAMAAAAATRLTWRGLRARRRRRRPQLRL